MYIKNMGNIFNKDKPKLIKNSSLTRLLLTDHNDDIFERLTKLENNMNNINTRYNNIITSYTETISSIKTEICNINNRNNELTKIIRTLNTINDENTQKIITLEKKLINLESNDEFLSTVDLNE